MPRLRDSRSTSLLALAVAVVSIAWSAIFVRWTHMPGLASAFYRVLIASAALWLMLLTRRTALSRPNRRTLLLAALGGLFFAVDVGSYNIAVLHTGAGSATFLGNNAPLAVGLLSWLLTRKPPSTRFWAALVLALLGAWLIISLDLRQFRLGGTGDLLASLASVAFALYLVTTEHVRNTLDAVLLITLSSTVSTVALLGAALLSHVPLSIPGLPAAASLVGLGVVCQVGGYVSLTYALGHTSATISSVMLLAVAPATAVLAAIFFAERMSWPQWIGGALILAAVWLVSSERTEVLAEALLVES